MANGRKTGDSNKKKKEEKNEEIEANVVTNFWVKTKGKFIIYFGANFTSTLSTRSLAGALKSCCP